MEVEILKEALDKARRKKPNYLMRSPLEDDFSEGDRSGARVSRSALHDRLKGESKSRGPYVKADDAIILPMLMALVSARLTYGKRRITALLNRQTRRDGNGPNNHKHVYRIRQANHLLLARKYAVRPDYRHEGKVVTMRSNQRWCSDGFEFHCWNGEVAPGAFIIAAHDREIISWRAVTSAGISGSDVRDMMLEAVESRFGACRTPTPTEMLTDNGAAYFAHETRIFARQIRLEACFTAVKSPQSNGISEAFVHTLKRDYVHVSPLLNARHALALLASWIEDYNENHPTQDLKCAHRESSERLSSHPPEGVR